MRTLIIFFSNLLYILELCIIIDVLLSWIPISENKFTDMIHKISAPFLKPGRKLQYKYISNSPIDFSPILAFVIIRLIRQILFFIY